MKDPEEITELSSTTPKEDVMIKLSEDDSSSLGESICSLESKIDWLSKLGEIIDVMSDSFNKLVWYEAERDADSSMREES